MHVSSVRKGRNDHWRLGTHWRAAFHFKRCNYMPHFDSEGKNCQYRPAFSRCEQVAFIIPSGIDTPRKARHLLLTAA
jgi:hypothetical protein